MVMDGSMLDAPELFRLRDEVDMKGKNPAPERNSASWLVSSEAPSGETTVGEAAAWKRSHTALL